VNDDLQWIKDIDGVSYNLEWYVKSSWHSKRLNRKFRDAVKTWVHPRHQMKVIRIDGNIDREFSANRWVWLRIETTVGRMLIQEGFMDGDEVYIVDFYKRGIDWNYDICECSYIHKNLTPQLLLEQLNKLGDV
jgi:hypothetical protein